MFRKLRIVVVLMVVFVSSFGMNAGAMAQQADFQRPEFKSGDTTTIESTPQEQQALIKALSREAHQAAKPVDMPVVTDAEIQAMVAAGAKPEAEKLQPGFSESGKPDPASLRLARRQYPAEWRGLDLPASLDPMADMDAAMDAAMLAPDGTNGVYTSFIGNYYTQMHRYYPYVTVGKLFIGGGGYCSASVISPNNIIVTAAHCVYDTVNNKWKSGFVFVPASRNGAAPYGTFPYTSARILNAYINASNGTTGRQFDIAVLTLGRNSAGNTVTFYTGWLGRSWNYGYVQSLFAIGYPSNLTNGTLYTYVCAAESSYWSTDIMGMGCNMMHGSSGGPWIRVFTPYQTGAKNYVTSVVSGGNSGASTWGNTFYGPRFTSNNIVVLCNAQGC